MKFTREKIKALITQFDPSILNVGLCKLLSQRSIPLYSQPPSSEEQNVVSVHKFIYNTLTYLLDLVEESVDEEQFITLLEEACQAIDIIFGVTFDFHKSLLGVGDYVRNTILLPENIEKKWVNDSQSLSLASSPTVADLKHATEILSCTITSGDVEATLRMAAKNGNLAIIAVLIAQGADVQAHNTESETALHLAAENGHTACLIHLITKGADVHTITESSETALHLAAKNGHTMCVTALIEHCADVHAVDDYRETALHYAAAYGHSTTIKTLISAGADPNIFSRGVTALYWAAFFGREDAVSVLIGLGADVHAVNPHNRATALMVAAQKGYTAIVSALIKKGASVNHVNKDHETPLMKASDGGHTSTVAILCEHGADLNAVDVYGKTPLMYATTWRDHADIIATLIIQGARTDMVNLVGETALSLAQARNHINSVTMLRTGLDSLQRTCQRRDEEVGIMIVYRMFAGMPFNLAKRISSFDCDPNLEYLPQNTLLHLKESVTKRQIPYPTANSNATASAKKVFKIRC